MNILSFFALLILSFVLKVAGCFYIHKDSKKRGFKSPALITVLYFFWYYVASIAYLIVVSCQKEDKMRIREDASNDIVNEAKSYPLPKFLIALIVIDLIIKCLCLWSYISILSDLIDSLFSWLFY